MITSDSSKSRGGLPLLIEMWLNTKDPSDAWIKKNERAILKSTDDIC